MSEWRCPVCGARRKSFGLTVYPLSRTFDVCENDHKQLHYPKPHGWSATPTQGDVIRLLPPSDDDA